MIRGESAANAPLILLHGGPGLSETRSFRLFNAPAGEELHGLYWDQRGASKSFQSDIPRCGTATLDESSSLRSGPPVEGGDSGSLGLVARSAQARATREGRGHVGSGQPRQLRSRRGGSPYGSLMRVGGIASAEEPRRPCGRRPRVTAKPRWTGETWVTRLEGGMRVGACGNHGYRDSVAEYRSAICRGCKSLRF